MSAGQQTELQIGLLSGGHFWGAATMAMAPQLQPNVRIPDNGAAAKSHLWWREGDLRVSVSPSQFQWIVRHGESRLEAP